MHLFIGVGTGYWDIGAHLDLDHEHVTNWRLKHCINQCWLGKVHPCWRWWRVLQCLAPRLPVTFRGCSQSPVTHHSRCVCIVYCMLYVVLYFIVLSRYLVIYPECGPPVPDTIIFSRLLKLLLQLLNWRFQGICDIPRNDPVPDATTKLLLLFTACSQLDILVHSPQAFVEQTFRSLRINEIRMGNHILQVKKKTFQTFPDENIIHN